MEGEGGACPGRPCFCASDANVYVTLTLPEYTLRMIAVKMLIVGEIESHGEYILMPRQYGEAKAQDKSTQNKRTSGREILHTYRAILIWYAWKHMALGSVLLLRLAAMLNMIGVKAFSGNCVSQYVTHDFVLPVSLASSATKRAAVLLGRHLYYTTILPSSQFVFPALSTSSPQA